MSSEPQTIRRPRKWPLYLGAFAALLLVLYFVVTSAFFIRAMVLPRVETAIGCKLEVGDLSLSPFSQLELRNVKVTPIGAEPLAQVELIRLRYNLRELLGGKIQAHEITVEKPVVTLVELADGTRNLPKLPPSGPKSTAPVILDLHQIQLRNGQLTYVVRGPAAAPVQTMTVTDLNLTVDHLVTDQPGKLSIGGQAGLTRLSVDRVAGKLGGELSVTLGPDALPKLVKGSLGVELTEAVGAFRDASGLSLALESDVTEKEVRDLRLSFRRAGQELGRVRLSGPYDAAKPEVRMDYELSGIDRRVLVLVSGALGYDIGETSAAAKGKISLLKNGELIASNGELSLSRLSLGTPAGRTPSMDLRAQYKVEANLKDQSALVEALQLTATDARGEWLSGALDRPMNFAWGKNLPEFRPAGFVLKLSRFELGDWRALLGTNAPLGNLRVDLEVQAEKNGHLLTATLAGAASQLKATVGGSQLSDGLFEFSAAGTLKEFSTAELSRFGFALKQGPTLLVSGSVLGDWQTQTLTGGAQVNAEGEVAPLLGLFPVAGISAQNGRFKLNAQAGKKEKDQTIQVGFVLDKFTGQVQGSALTNYETAVQLTATLISTNVVDLQRFNVSLGNVLAPGGSLDASGRWDLAKKAGNFDYQIVNLNQSAVEPWLAPVLKPNRLLSLTIDAAGKAQVDLSADTAITTELKIANLRSQNPAGQVTGPLNLGLTLDAGGRQSLLELRPTTLRLGATERAKNELVVSGRLDLAATNAAPSVLSIRSEGLDLTPLYQLLAGDPAAKSAVPPQTAPAPQPAEPDPLKLPLARLTADLDIAKLYLGSITAEKWKGRVDVNSSVITVKPFDLMLNGSPVTITALANLGVPGWQYDFNLQAPNLELSPFVDTFRPDYKGRVGGRLSAEAAFKGAGITGLGFQKNLTGGFNIHSTNLNIDLAGLQAAKKSQTAKLASKPKAGVLSSIGEAFGGFFGLAVPGWYEEIMRSPVDTVILRGETSAGRLALKEGLIQSPLLRVQPSGGFAFAPVLNDSKLNVPVALALRGGVARQLGLSQDTNQYIALPPLLTVLGTLGQPEPKVDKLAVGQLLAKSSVGGAAVDAVGGLLNKVTDGKAGAVTEQVGNVLNVLTGSGGKTGTGTVPTPGTAPAGANPAPRKPSAFDLLNTLTRPKTTATNTSAPATPPAPAPKK